MTLAEVPMPANSGKKTRGNIRLAVQILFFMVVLSIVAGHALADAGISIPILSDASLHAVCPFGGVVSLYQWISQGSFVKKVHESSLILGGLVLILAIALGPVFCGWSVPSQPQEWIGKLGRKIFKRRYNAMVPPTLDAILRYLRYVVLLWVLYMTAVTGLLIFADFDPYYTLFNFWTGEVALSGIIILLAVLILSLAVERPFCKYACPYGAVLGLSNLIRLFPVRRRSSSCIDCKLCDRRCPMNIEVSITDRVRDHQCISCNECSSEAACPRPDTVAMRFKPWKQGGDQSTSADAGGGLS
jgi:ferredoxin